MIDVKIVSVSLPFGKHKDKPLGDVPVDDLQWLLRTAKLSGGLRLAVASELSRRGFAVPPPQPPRPLRPCRDHPEARLICLWMEDTLGRRRIRAECSVCRRPADYPPCVPPYTDEADANASTTPILDVLTRLEALGVELQSDGRGVQLSWQDYRKVPPDLHAVIRQCSHQLAKMIGNNRRAEP